MQSGKCEGKRHGALNANRSGAKSLPARVAKADL